MPSHWFEEVYLIGILDFSMGSGEQDRYFHDVALVEKTSNEIFYNKLGFKFLEPRRALSGQQELIVS